MAAGERVDDEEKRRRELMRRRMGCRVSLVWQQKGSRNLVKPRPNMGSHVSNWNTTSDGEMQKLLNPKPVV